MKDEGLEDEHDIGAIIEMDILSKKCHSDMTSQNHMRKRQPTYVLMRNSNRFNIIVRAISSLSNLMIKYSTKLVK